MKNFGVLVQCGYDYRDSVCEGVVFILFCVLRRIYIRCNRFYIIKSYPFIFFIFHFVTMWWRRRRRRRPNDNDDDNDDDDDKRLLNDDDDDETTTRCYHIFFTLLARIYTRRHDYIWGVPCIWKEKKLQFHQKPTHTLTHSYYYYSKVYSPFTIHTKILKMNYIRDREIVKGEKEERQKISNDKKWKEGRKIKDRFVVVFICVYIHTNTHIYTPLNIQKDTQKTVIYPYTTEISTRLTVHNIS